jgi:hypothetical protein
MPYRLRLPIHILILGLFLGAGPGAGASDASQESAPMAPMPRIDQKGIHDEYINGNFEIVLKRIETFRQKNPDHSREDSLFIARHLAVVLAADPRSVEAGKYWMHRLLLLSPDADLSGMYASEAIERMFGEVKREDDARMGRSGRRKWLWIGAGGTAVAAGFAVWFAFSHAGDGPGRTVVPVNL